MLRQEVPFRALSWRQTSIVAIAATALFLAVYLEFGRDVAFIVTGPILAVAIIVIGVVSARTRQPSDGPAALPNRQPPSDPSGGFLIHFARHGQAPYTAPTVRFLDRPTRLVVLNACISAFEALGLQEETRRSSARADVLLMTTPRREADERWSVVVEIVAMRRHSSTESWIEALTLESQETQHLLSQASAKRRWIVAHDVLTMLAHRSTDRVAELWDQATNLLVIDANVLLTLAAEAEAGVIKPDEARAVLEDASGILALRPGSTA